MTVEAGDEVAVNETNIREWYGQAVAVKPSRKSGLWVEVRREDGTVWTMPVRYVTKREDA